MEFQRVGMSKVTSAIVSILPVWDHSKNKGLRRAKWSALELAAIPLFFSHYRPSDSRTGILNLLIIQNLAASYGYTTAQEGRARPTMSWWRAMLTGKFLFRCRFYIDIHSLIAWIRNGISREYSTYRIGGFKDDLDGFTPRPDSMDELKPYLFHPMGQKEGYLRLSCHCRW